MAAPTTAPTWRRAFLRALARGGSVALAADKAGIDRTSAYQVRKANAAFAASWDRAVAYARAELAAAGGARGTLRLRGDEVVGASKAGKPCIVRAGPGRWCRDSEQAFLAELAASANVKAAARAAGVSPVAAYARRRRWPAFAAAWDASRAEGWLRLEMLLICAASATLEPEPEVAAAERAAGPAMSVEQALQLWFHRPGARAAPGSGRGHGWRRQEPDIEEVRAEILRKVAAMERARAAKG